MNVRIKEFQDSKIQPIVIIGMHRSGTSLLAELLERCGLFIGKDIAGNYESGLFMLINDTIFSNCYSVWSKPFGVHHALRDETLTRSLAMFAVKNLVANGARYFGVGTSEPGQFPNTNHVWGWKDPRSTFTLPVWKYIFPRLKIIHIMRHGVDAAYSLYQRDWVHQEIKKGARSSLSIVRDQFGLHHARPCCSLEESFLLWEEYVEEAMRQVQTYNNDSMQIKYEEFLQEPESILRNILSFCGIDIGTLPPRVLENIDESKAYSYKRFPELLKFADEWSETLSRFGY